MKKILFSVITVLLLIPSSSLFAFSVGRSESVILPAMDPRVLNLFKEPKEVIAAKQIELLQIHRDQVAEIKRLESTIEERSWIKGRNTGLSIGLGIGTLATVLAAVVFSRNSGSSYSRLR